MATLPTTGVEFSYPIQNQAQSNREAYPVADRQWKSVEKTASFWRHEVCTLRCRVHEVNFKTFYDFLVANKGLDITLDTPGVIPFIRSTTSNTVQLLDFSQPTATMGRHKEFTVTFLNNARTPTT